MVLEDVEDPARFLPCQLSSALDRMAHDGRTEAEGGLPGAETEAM